MKNIYISPFSLSRLYICLTIIMTFFYEEIANAQESNYTEDYKIAVPDPSFSDDNIHVVYIPKSLPKRKAADDALANKIFFFEAKRLTLKANILGFNNIHSPENLRELSTMENNIDLHNDTEMNFFADDESAYFQYNNNVVRISAGYSNMLDASNSFTPPQEKNTLLTTFDDKLFSVSHLQNSVKSTGVAFDYLIWKNFRIELVYIPVEINNVSSNRPNLNIFYGSDVVYQQEELNLDQYQFGKRVSIFMNGVQFTASYLYGYDNQYSFSGIGKSENGKIQYTLKKKRVHKIDSAISGKIGQVDLWVNGNGSFAGNLNAENDPTIRNDNFNWLFGINWNIGKSNNIKLSFQNTGHYIIGYTSQYSDSTSDTIEKNNYLLSGDDAGLDLGVATNLKVAFSEKKISYSLLSAVSVPFIKIEGNETLANMIITTNSQISPHRYMTISFGMDFRFDSESNGTENVIGFFETLPPRTNIGLIYKL